LVIFGGLADVQIFPDFAVVSWVLRPMVGFVGLFRSALVAEIQRAAPGASSMRHRRTRRRRALLTRPRGGEDHLPGRAARRASTTT
jgi:hypothetical protein